MANDLTFVGARAIFTINKVIIGWARECSGSQTVQLQPVDVIGNLAPLEYQATGYVVQFRARLFRLLGKSLKQLGIFPKFDDILLSGEMSARIEDKYTGEVIVNLVRVKARDINFTLDARGLYSEEVSFAAIRDIANEVK